MSGRAGSSGGYVLALDQGTTSSRAMVFDARGRVRGAGQVPLAASYPRPGWVEQDPEAIWATTVSATGTALAEARLGATDIAAVGVANQRETTLLWDRATGRPLHPAISWQCRRTAELCRTLEAEGWGSAVAARTGLRLDPYFSATKLAWLLNNVPGARAAARRGQILFGTVDTWLLWRLTGGALHATDETNASRTMLYDIHRRCWDAELCARLGIPPGVLPEVRPTGGPFAPAHPGVLGAAVPVAALVGDQQAALIGQGGLTAGAAKATYGTGCFLLLHTGGQAAAPSRGLLTTIALGRGAAGVDYALEGSVFSAGATVQWLRDGLGLVRRVADVQRRAAAVPDSGGVVLVPAFFGLGAPDWDPDARGLLIGLTAGTTGDHICRAALEAIAHQTAEVLDLMRAAGGIAPGVLRADGGASANNLLLQLQADLAGIPVLRPRQIETTAWGAALVAGVAAGLWPDLTMAASRVPAGRRFEPGLAESERVRRQGVWRRAVERSLGWARPADLRPAPGPR